MPFKTDWAASGGRLREINPASTSEIHLVAQRMQRTLIDVLGEEKGRSLYTMDWLIERVRWHLDPSATTAKIFLAESRGRHITGQAIARTEHGEDRAPFGYFSTLYVEPESRQQGIATNLVAHVENWLAGLKMPKIVYNTAATNAKLIDLFRKRGYEITHSQDDMVQLTRLL